MDLLEICIAEMNLIRSLFISLSIFFGAVYTDCPTIVTKDQWDGLTAVRVKYLKRPVDVVIIQHTATNTCNSDASCEEIVRNIQNNQMDNLNFWDIGINFLVGGNGKIYEGCGWLHVGAHTYGYNSESIAISFIGNFNDDQPKPEMLVAAQELIKCGVENGHLSPDYYLIGHKQVIAIESPGRKLYREIRTWPHWLEDATIVKKKYYTRS